TDSYMRCGMRTWLTRFSRLHSTTLGLLLMLMVLLLFWFDEAQQTPKPFVVAWLHRLELLASDLRFRVRGPIAPRPEVVIAAIDEQGGTGRACGSRDATCPGTLAPEMAC